MDFVQVAITRRFERRIVFTVVMQKIESRKWNFSSESFQEYAMDKLLLMQLLGSKDDDIIHLLINGISHLSIKSAAVTIRADSVDHFLNEMHHLSTICSDSLKKNQASGSRFEKTKDNHKYNKLSTGPKSSDDSNGKNSPQKQDLFCIYCRNKGHHREDCLKLKKKEQHQKSTSSKTSPAVAAVEEQPEDITPVVALVDNDCGKKIVTDSMILKVVKINNINCDLVTLLDTGSPVSFICPASFNEFFVPSSITHNDSKQLYKALNNTPIATHGLITSNIQLESLPDLTALINLHVLDKECIIAFESLKKELVSAPILCIIYI